MKHRKCLEGTILLSGESESGRFQRAFTIDKKISEGASVICYEAHYKNSGRGVLKEFYPKDVYSLKRAEGGQLILSSSEPSDERARFQKLKDDYLVAYKMLLLAKQSGNEQDLATFIPAFEIYHGCYTADDAVGTIYIWTPETKLETFDKVCDEIHKHPTKAPEHKLFTVLTAVESLAKCVRALHSAGLIHRDIKPSNFGFLKRGDETLTQTLSVFDIDSISSVFTDFEEVVGTRGFMEPEAGYEEPDNQTDIFSIGATLFNAIIVTDEAKESGYRYQPEYYDRLRDMVDESKLIRASEANSNPKLRKMLALILSRSLCDRAHRYANCEELIDDLGTALFYALPPEIARRNRFGEKWTITDVEKSLDVHKEKNSYLAIQYHLYEHPLYLASSVEDSTIDILVIGFGNYGQKFLDASLQAGQIHDKVLNVTVLAGDDDDKEIYLTERPELNAFFNIDGSCKDEESTYGNIAFGLIDLDRSNQRANKEDVERKLREYFEPAGPHYVFIALGDDKLNEDVARVCQKLSGSCVVSYVCEGDQKAAKAGARICPLFVNADIKKSHLYAEVERMAFNAHLVWEKNLNVDYRSIKAEFRKAYNHDSCVSTVLAIKYKLHSIGIELNSDFNEAARLFSEALSGDSGAVMKDKLVWIEHRRWVTEKLCLGWRRIRDLSECSNGASKDEKRKRHICIVRSNPGSKLSGDFIFWDKARQKELEQLDELDRLSVELHQMYAKRASETRKHNLLSGSNVANIKTLVGVDRDAAVAFREWLVCLKGIWNGDIAKVRLYRGLKSTFLESLENFPVDVKKAVLEETSTLETAFYPVLASTEYRDWKRTDEALVDNIPFMLTYTEHSTIAIPLSVGNASCEFGNVAAPTVVSPERVIYLYLIESEQDLRRLTRAVLNATGYMDRKHLKAQVELVMLYTSEELINEQDKHLLLTRNARIKRVSQIFLDSQDNAALQKTLAKRREQSAFFAIEKNETKLSRSLEALGVYARFQNFRFQSSQAAFTDIAGCEMLGYIRKSPYITVADIAKDSSLLRNYSNQPEFFDRYETLWKRYCEDISLWDKVCSILAENREKDDVLASFDVSQRPDRKNEKDLHYILPFACSRGAAAIVKALKERNLVGQESSVFGYTTDSCEVTVLDTSENSALLDALFSNVYALMLPEAISFRSDRDGSKFEVIFDNLVVSSVRLGKDSEDIFRFMSAFRNDGYIIHLSMTHQGDLSFTYATRQIKELLTNPEKILEVYTYHKIKEYGYFDDVISVSWPDEETEQEKGFDCIVTRGFQTLFVECKSKDEITQKSLGKIGDLARNVGINATGVMIATPGYRGMHPIQEELDGLTDGGVVQIFNLDSISNIGDTLKHIMNGSYRS